MTDDRYAEDDAILARCKRNGVPIGAIYGSQIDSISGEVKRELLQLCLNVEAAQRAERSWQLTLASAIVAALSALAAWTAVFFTVN